MVTTPITSVREYLSFVEKDTRSSVHGNLALFRGQRDATWSLVPSIVRSPIFDSTKSLAKDPKSPDDKSAERRLLIVFRDLAVALLPEWVWTGSAVETEWKHVLVAQHYRLPTRLLDWSSNPLVALYFAAEGKTEGCKPDCTHKGDLDNGKGQHHSAVFVLRGRDSFSVSSLAVLNQRPPVYEHGDDPGVIRPPAIDKRMVAQSGLFTISKDPASPIAAERMLIHADHREVILRELDTCGVNRRTMYPDLESLGEYLRWSVPRWEPNPCR